jgi:hypothetical protein
MVLDTGVDPSVIDSARAKALGLPVDHGAGGEATGEGDAKQVQIFSVTIEGLVINGHHFPAIDAAAFDIAPLSARYGRPLDGAQGYGFLNGRVWLSITH